jgi:amphi-Trp domain-containing protein
MDKDKIELKTIMESAAVAEYLTALAKGFKSGSITVEKDGESLTLVPAEVAEVEVEARMKKDKARFSLEVTWRMASALDEPASLTISAEPPKAEAKPEAAAKPCCAGKAAAETESAAKPAAKPEVKPAPAAASPAAKPEVKPATSADPKAPAK